MMTSRISIAVVVLAAGMFFGVPAPLSAQIWTWTGAVNNSWANEGNWDPDDEGVPAATTDLAIFGDFGTDPLEVIQSQTFGDIEITADAQADLAVQFNSTRGFRNITIDPDSGLQTLHASGTAAGNLRYQSSGTFSIPVGKTVVYENEILRHAGGGATVLTVEGGGTFEIKLDQIGVNRDASGPSPDGVRLNIESGTLSISEGTGQILQAFTTDVEAQAFRSVFWTLGENSTLAMEVGNSGDRVDFLLPDEPNDPLPVQGDWLLIPDEGATLHVRKTPDFSLNTWYTLFRNVNQPDNDFTNVTGLAAGELASFRLFEYDSGFFDYQVMIIPEPGTAGLLLLGGASWLLLRARSRKTR